MGMGFSGVMSDRCWVIVSRIGGVGERGRCACRRRPYWPSGRLAVWPSPSRITLGINIGVELIQRRLRALLGELHRLVDDRFGLCLDLVQRRFGYAGVQQPRFDQTDWVALAPLRDLLLGAITLQEVGGPVRGDAVGHRFNGIGGAGLTHPLRGSLGDL